MTWTSAEVSVHWPSNTARVTLYVPGSVHSWDAVSCVTAVVELWTVCCASAQLHVQVRFCPTSGSEAVPVKVCVVFVKAETGPAG